MALFAFILLISAVGLVEASKKKLAAGGFNQTTSTNGKEIFNNSCAQSHGEDGKKKVMGAVDLTATPLDQQAIITTIRKGKSIMVGYGGILPDAQIEVYGCINRIAKIST